MGTYVIKRVLLMIPTFVLISLLVFIIINLAPGRAGQLQLTGGQGESVRESAGAREGYLLFKLGYGLNRPLLFNTRYNLELGEVQRHVETIASNLTVTVPGETEAMAVGATVAQLLQSWAAEELPRLEAARAALDAGRTPDDALADVPVDSPAELMARILSLGEIRATEIEIRPPRPPAGDLVDAFEDLENWGMYAVPHLVRLANEHPNAKVRWQAVEFLTLNAQDRTIDADSGAVVSRQPERLMERLFQTTTPALMQASLSLAPVPSPLSSLAVPALRRTYSDALRSGLPRYDVRNWHYPLGGRVEERERAMELWNAWFARNQSRFEYDFWERAGIFFFDTGLAKYWGDLFRGNLGVSAQYRRPVTEIIFERWKYSIYLSVLSLLLAYFLSLPIGLYSAAKQGGLFDRGMGVLLILLYSLPSFFVATLLSDFLSEAEAPASVWAVLRWSVRAILIGIMPIFIASLYRSRALRARSGPKAALGSALKAWGLAVGAALAFTELLFLLKVWLLVFALILAWPLWSALRAWRAEKRLAAASRSTEPVPFPIGRLTGLMVAGTLGTLVLAGLAGFFPGPVSGFSTEGELLNHTLWEHFVDVLNHLVFPVACLTYASLALLSRYARTGLLDVIRSDYIRTARAKGLSEPVVILKHAVRNGMIPILTLLATALPALIGGSVVIEVIFGIPGLGQLIFSSVIQKDFTVVMGVLQISAVLTMFGILLSDISYALVDPRITFD